MNYRTLGKSGIKVSEISLGCEGFTNKSAEETTKLLEYAYKKG